jgi:dTDP-4-dehydrorhamnose reductase
MVEMIQPGSVGAPSSVSSELAFPTPRLPILITGVAGVAGYNAFHYFQALYPGQVVGLRRADNWPLSGPGLVGCNLEDEQGLEELFAQWEFGTVLDCDGSCALKSCELDPKMARRANVLGVENVLRNVQRSGSRLVRLSIDLVFSGTRGGSHRATDATDPVTVYGKTMVEAEELVLSQTPEACILRISLPMGISFNGHAGAIDWIQARFQKGKPATLYYDEVRTPTYCDCMNLMLHQLANHPLSGLHHAGGQRSLSLYEIAQIVNRVGGYDPDLLMGCYRMQAGPIPPRAGNVTMDSRALNSKLGRELFTPWPFDEAWVPTTRDWHYERSSEPGSPELLAQSLYRNPVRSQLPNPVPAH